MQTLRARPALAIFLAILVLLLLTGAAYAIGKLTGYIPGVGLVDQSAPIRVLAEPVSQTRQGVTITVTRAILSADKTAIFVKVEGVPANAYPEGELGGCLGSVNLRLSNGTLLEGGFISGGNWSSFEGRLDYGPIPANANDGVLLFNCIGGTKPGALPGNWEIPVRFAAAPPDLTVAPVIELSTPVATNPSASEGTGTPTLSNTMRRDGITLTLEKFVEAENGYLLYASLDLSKLVLPDQGNTNYALANPNGLPVFKMTDANGNRIPIESGLDPDTPYDPKKISWIIRTNQTAFAGPLVISLASVEAEIYPQVPLELDLGADPQIGQSWQINRDLDFEGHTVHLLSAQLQASTTPEWAALLEVTYESEDYGIDINMTDAIPQTPLIQNTSGGGGGGGGPLTGIRSTVQVYSSIPTGLRRFTVSANVPYSIAGPWQVVWNAPSSSGPVPTPQPEACLTSEEWEQLKNQHERLPADLSGKVLFTTDHMPPDINIFIGNLDGSDQRGLASGYGYHPTLSPDGTHLAYVSSVGLSILDLNSRQTVSFQVGDYPLWSPDGTHILLLGSPGELYVMNADGTGMAIIKTGMPRVQPVGWLPDNQTIVFSAQMENGPSDQVFKTFNLRTEETKSLFPITIKTAYGAISPDGQWIAFNKRVFGSNPESSLFVSKLDGSDLKSIARLDNATAGGALWSPDGQWLIVNVWDMHTAPPVLVNPFTCQSIRLENIPGEVQSWRP